MDYFLLIPLLLCCFVTSTYASNLRGIFIFGDSLFDAGNNHFNKGCSVQADFPPYGSTFFHHPTGRFTNGRTVVDFISQTLGIELQKPYLEAHFEVLNGTEKDYPENGMNFASAGSGVLRGTNQKLGVTPILDQLQQFQTLLTKNLITKELVQQSLFFFESGSNDIFNYFTESQSLIPDAYVQSMLTEVHQFINQIFELGARRVAIFSLGQVGCVPARALIPNAPVGKCFGKMNKMVKNYNQGLDDLLKNVASKYSGGVGVYGNVYNMVQHFRDMPTRYGFVNVTSACCGFGTLGGQVQCGIESYKVCPDPDKFLFWDYFHPSEHTYKLISKILWAGGEYYIRPFNLSTMATLTMN